MQDLESEEYSDLELAERVIAHADMLNAALTDASEAGLKLEIEESCFGKQVIVRVLKPLAESHDSSFDIMFENQHNTVTGPLTYDQFVRDNNITGPSS